MVNGDLHEAVRMLAACNARLCDIALAADKIVEAFATVNEKPPKGVDLVGWVGVRMRRIHEAIAAYKVIRQGN